MNIPYTTAERLYRLAYDRICVVCKKPFWTTPDAICEKYLHKDAYEFLLEVKDVFDTHKGI